MARNASSAAARSFGRCRIREYRRVPQSFVEAPLPSRKVCDIKPRPYIATRGWVFAHREMSTHPLQRGAPRCNADHPVATRTTPLQRGRTSCRPPVATRTTPLQHGALQHRPPRFNAEEQVAPPRCNADHPVATWTDPVATQSTPLQRGRTSCNAVQRETSLSLSFCPLLQGMGQAAGVAAADALDMSARRRRRRRRRSPCEGLSRRASYRTHGVSSGAPAGTETLGNRRGPSRLWSFLARLTAVGADVAW
jgi:hypothetical protein